MTDSRALERLAKYPPRRRFLAGFQGTTLPAFLRDQLALGLAGVVLYPRNFESVVGLIALTSEIREAARGPVLIGIDQEGGTRFSLPSPFTQWPSPAELGALGDLIAVRRVGEAIGRELAAAGCNMNFAPMLDLHVNPASPVTQRRSYGVLPDHVAKMGVAFQDGLALAGIISCAKHFPGHGDAAVDPHEDLPVFRGDAMRLADMEFVPFQAAVAAGVPAIMTAHILLPALDPKYPASLSRRMLTEELRERMRFNGVILADDLGMGAIARRYPLAESVITTFSAGTDIAMLCHDLSRLPPAIDAATSALESGQLTPEIWDAAGARIENLLALAGTAQPQDLSVIGSDEHQEFAASLLQRVGSLSRVAS